MVIQKVRHSMFSSGQKDKAVLTFLLRNSHTTTERFLRMYSLKCPDSNYPLL
jgi:hypothetical protein